MLPALTIHKERRRVINTTGKYGWTDAHEIISPIVLNATILYTSQKELIQNITTSLTARNYTAKKELIRPVSLLSGPYLYNAYKELIPQATISN